MLSGLHTLSSFVISRNLSSFVRVITVPSTSIVFARPLSDSKRRPPSKSDIEDPIFQDIHDRIAKYKNQLRKHAVSSYKSRELSTSIANLSQSMAAVQQKKNEADTAASLNAIANIPAFVSIEILSNGTTQLRPCVALRTPLKTYLFNCPEGTSRFLPSLRLKSLNVHDLFITRGTWDNIGGISSILLSKEAAAPPMRIHGAMNVKHFLECIRPFQDSDFGSVKYPSQVDECPYTTGFYEDAGLSVTYIPLSTPMAGSGPGSSTDITVDVAYLVELKNPARKIDPFKLISNKVPKGPLIGHLKAGQSITLPDGRVIKPEDVYVEEKNTLSEKKRLLVVECADLARLEALIESSVVRPFSNGSQTLEYVVHLTNHTLLQTPKYKEWMKSLGETCEHIVVNGNGPAIPHTESIYRNQRVLRRFLPAVFPDLEPAGWTGTVTQNSDLCHRDSNIVHASPLQRFFMRQGGSEDPIIIDLRAGLTEEENQSVEMLTEEEKEVVENRIGTLLEESANVNQSEFPAVSFLGTSSAVPSKYRNVSGYLVETSPSSSFMVDVGEGSYGQIRCIFGEESTVERLLSLHAIFITHAHQDHMNGLYTIIERRKEAFEKKGIPYVPLVLVCNSNVLKPLKTYSMCFSDLQSLVAIVNLSVTPDNYKKSPPGSPSSHQRRSSPPLLTPTRNVTELLPKAIYDKNKWKLDDVVAVQVHHTRMANGFVFSIEGKKVVFSGDTKPCQLLVDEGKGADLLIHEATFEDGCERDAERKKHSTMGQAVEIGRKMGAKHVLLTHFSARYPKVPALPTYLDEAGNVGVAMDNMRARYDHLPLIPKLIPLYRDAYREELFEIELRKDQRNLKSKDEEKETEKSSKQGSKVATKKNDGYDFYEAKRVRREQKPWTRPTGQKGRGTPSDDEAGERKKTKVDA